MVTCARDGKPRSMKLACGSLKTTEEIISQQLAPIQMTSRRLREATDFKDARLPWNWKILKEIHRCTFPWFVSQLSVLNR